MAAERIRMGGIVKDGVVIPEGGVTLPEGVHVEIIYAFGHASPELQAEFDAWDRAGQNAWAMIDQWEREEVK